MGIFRRWAEILAGLFYPEVCQICGVEWAPPSAGYVCERCRGTVRYVVPPFCRQCGLPFPGEITMPFACGNCRGMRWAFEYARAAAVAQGTLREIIHRFKYHKARWFAPYLADLVVRRLGTEAAGWDVLVPIPLSARKLAQREFNQADDIASLVGSRLGLRVVARGVQRIKDTDTQTRLNRRHRLANVRGAFRVRDPALISGHCVLLIDDVLTTGATAHACALALRGGGARRVAVWTVARGL